VPDYSGCKIAVDKNDGAVKAYGVLENIKLIVNSEKINIPDEYKYKLSK
jgi:hypothetical protein